EDAALVHVAGQHGHAGWPLGVLRAAEEPSDVEAARTPGPADLALLARGNVDEPVGDDLEDRLGRALHLLRLAGPEGDLRSPLVAHAGGVDPGAAEHEAVDALARGRGRGLELERRSVWSDPARVRSLRGGHDLEVGRFSAPEVQTGGVVDDLPFLAGDRFRAAAVGIDDEMVGREQ